VAEFRRGDIVRVKKGACPIHGWGKDCVRSSTGTIVQSDEAGGWFVNFPLYSATRSWHAGPGELELADKVVDAGGEMEII
jgi:hypothetical protein